MASARARGRFAPRPLPAACLVAVVLLAGCSDAPAPTAQVPPPAPTGGHVHDPPAASPSASGGPAAPDAMEIAGIVQTTAFEPIAGARVVLRGTDLSAATGADGRFAFAGLRPMAYLLDVAAQGYAPATLRVEPAAHAAVDVQLQAVAAPEARVDTAEFAGHFQCALEAAIISGSCDAALTSNRTLGMDPVFTGNATFDVEAAPGWRTAVVDVVFDTDDHPGVAGLRVVAKGLKAQGELGEYEQYGRFFGPSSFTFRLEPGASYDEGEVPVPLNATSFQFDVLPHSHGWHAACSPDGQCLLGVGAAVDLPFELYVSLFYGEPAPADWSFAQQAE